MRRSLLFAFLAFVGCARGRPPAPPPDPTPPSGSTLHGVYEGKIPCADCQRMKVRLTLHESTADGSATTYVLETISVGKGNDRAVARGRWSTTRGTGQDLDAVVVRLDESSPEELARYLAVDDLLLVLDADLVPRVGNANHSFTLSRTR